MGDDCKGGRKETHSTVVRWILAYVNVDGDLSHRTRACEPDSVAEQVDKDLRQSSGVGLDALEAHVVQRLERVPVNE